MTHREKEILAIIQKNPLISQQSLAQILGITRSSVAVHITNLMKKGYISGKGYIITEKKYIVVIGGANIDLQGFSHGPLMFHDSNPGKVKISLGGVGRNIAENLVKLGMDIKLITALGDDLYGNKILDECRLSGMDMDHCLLLKGASSSTYLSVLDEHRDMAVAIADMDIFDQMTIDFIRSKSHIIENAQFIILDTNLPRDVLIYLVTHFNGKKFFLDTVSTPKAKKVADHLGLFHTIKPNKLEAEALSGFKIHTADDLKKVLDSFLEKGVKNVFISLGKDGVYYGNDQGSNLLMAPPVDVVNATGAGDAFMAGLAYGHAHGYDIDHSVKFSMAASLLALSHENTINPSLSIDHIEKIVKEMQ